MLQGNRYRTSHPLASTSDQRGTLIRMGHLTVVVCKACHEATTISSKNQFCYMYLGLNSQDPSLLFCSSHVASRVTCEGPPKVTTTTRRTTTTSTARPTTPDPDPCTFGAACDGCGITTEFQGQVGRPAEGFSRTVQQVRGQEQGIAEVGLKTALSVK